MSNTTASLYAIRGIVPLPSAAKIDLFLTSDKMTGQSVGARRAGASALLPISAEGITRLVSKAAPRGEIESGISKISRAATTTAAYRRHDTQASPSHHPSSQRTASAVAMTFSHRQKGKNVRAESIPTSSSRAKTVLLAQVGRCQAISHAISFP